MGLSLRIGFTCLALMFAALPSQAATSREGLLKAVRAALPEKLREFKPGVTERTEIETKLGTPPRGRGSSVYFYELAGVKYDTTLQFNGKTVFMIRHQFGNKKLTGKDLAKWITGADYKAAKQQLKSQQQTHETGRVLELIFPELGLQLEVSNTREHVVMAANFRPPLPSRP